jgi:hypothetical protein
MPLLRHFKRPSDAAYSTKQRMGRLGPAHPLSHINKGANILRGGNVMARVTRKGRSKGSGRFLMLTFDLLSSHAWEGLSTQARAVLIQIAKVYDGKNNGRLGASHQILSDQSRISKNTVTRAIRELVEAGFLDVIQVGAFSLKARHASEYRITWQKCDKTGEPQTNRWRRNGLAKVATDRAPSIEPP